MKEWPDNCVDLVLTDPPYGVGKAEWDNRFNLEWLSTAARITNNALAIIPGNSNLLKMPKSINGAKYKWTLSVHIKNAIVRGATGFGNWIPCVVYVHNTGSIYSCCQDCGEVVIHGDMPQHPSPKPIDAMLWFVSHLPGNLILDPFCGSGTTCVAAKMLGRRFIGIDISEKYCEIARQRLEAVDTGVPVKEQKAGQMALFKKGEL